ncbi:Fur-regulated basic protein FbpA [uncultured Metabacillus sp.]|uniref:Fur-regulated basic protein FbpA n=1 Tax=Metabacillus sp. Hm71 TaxID=3450743 RepID=UPI0026298607|nr:Fur-regulated basic protein FbpA [uncultured Metabacillus sp.]
MSQLREAVFRRKEKLIQKLLALGIYKKEEHHLYELTLSEIETEYLNEIKRKKPN